MYRHLRVAVVIPAFNEERAISDAITTVPDFVDVVIVVDDASTDATATRAHAVARERGDDRIVVVTHATNRGVGAAIVTGYRRALALGCDVAAVMAGDGQMDPRDLPAVLAPIADDAADYVKGNRFLHPEVWTAMPPARIVGNLVLSAATKLTSGYRHVFDSQCGYTAISRRALERVELDGVFPRYGYPNDLLSRLHVAGMRVLDVRVRPVYGPAWKSGINLGTVIHPIPWVLLRSWSTRVASEARDRWRARA
jgi:glycosyltransferase involved in cell wall biosynthesis